MIADGLVSDKLLFVFLILPYFMIIVESLAVLLKGKAAIVISIINMAGRLPFIVIEGYVLFFIILSAMLGAGFKGVSKLIIEFLVEIVFLTATLTILVIKSDSIENKHKKIE